MCQWCIENSKCPCQIECEVELTASHAAGNIVSQCPRCRHTIQRIRQCLRINEFHPPNEDNWFCGDQIKIDIETNTTIKKIQEVENMIGAGLINRIEYDGKNTFVITPKGRQYLESYEKFSDFSESFGLDL